MYLHCINRHRFQGEVLIGDGRVFSSAGFMLGREYL